MYQSYLELCSQVDQISNLNRVSRRRLPFLTIGRSKSKIMVNNQENSGLKFDVVRSAFKFIENILPECMRPSAGNVNNSVLYFYNELESSSDDDINCWSLHSEENLGRKLFHRYVSLYIILDFIQSIIFVIQLTLLTFECRWFWNKITYDTFYIQLFLSVYNAQIFVKLTKLRFICVCAYNKSTAVFSRST